MTELFVSFGSTLNKFLCYPLTQNSARRCWRFAAT
ncbi:hypothetical protein PRUB_a6018 [Pseudoalteromonas rubra]|uniref:Uncharacterized protein n=1 Tax=Pseudoalteromonas rubra TaxID=43658 RepID=A0A8T0C4K4_9GAMM|nr:hypothetical protein PRUB_a6018 [Pseudoalteromonas rubra]